MKLSKKTIQLLENFSTINDNIVISEGSTLRSMSSGKNILVEAEVEEDFPMDLPIYSVSKFLRMYACIDNPQLTIENESSVLIHNNNDSIEFRLSDPSMVTTPPKKELNLPSEDVCFELTKETLSKVKKVAKAMELSHLAIVGDGCDITLQVVTKGNTGENKFKTTIGSTENNFVFYVRLENLKLLAGDYDITISKKNLMKLVNQRENLFYFVAIEPDSEWEETETTDSTETETYTPQKGEDEVTEEEGITEEELLAMVE